ncbi:TetR/AcrR family transcriptional regulator [Herbiconiux solani]|uniref:TetR/AcrR family transcriptional regulator n=1 Tax=Herbiconiux solani TaxID=661329 RepID=UPI0008266C1D|nr:TetR-like C-terminal domain-containing protein [Herbiconiux solani]
MPRAGVTSDRVAEEAEALADEVGLQNITLAAVAARLGIRLPSLYKHIDSLAALKATVGERAIRELTEVMARATVGRSGADAVGALARALRGWALEHPGRYSATVAPPRRGAVVEAAAVAGGSVAAGAAGVAGVAGAAGAAGADSDSGEVVVVETDAETRADSGEVVPEVEVVAAEAALEVIFDALAGFGLEGGDAIDATRALRSLLHGFVSLEAAGGFGMPDDVDRSFDRLVDAFIRALPGYASA